MTNSYKDIDVLNFSNYLKTLLSKDDYQYWLIEKNNINKYFSITDLYADLKKETSDINIIDEALMSFRRFKQKHFLRIAARDFTKRANFEEVVSQLSDIASVCLQVGIELLHSKPDLWLDHNKKELWEKEKKDIEIVVMGLGKLGGNELNYVSDIDIVYFFETKNNVNKKIINLLFQNLTKLISEYVRGDKVFEVDLRLRPAGKESEIMVSVDSALEYYLNFGQSWDRVSLVKASIAAGNRILGNKFLQEITPFVYRRFLDFQSLKELKNIRNKILKQNKENSFKNKINLKLGKGGIREIEFFVQSFQLVYGGRFRELREKNTLKVLNKLKELELVPVKEYNDLKDAYIFLRRLEHCAQLDNNRHTSTVSLREEVLDKYAYALGISNGKELRKMLIHRMIRVNELFKGLFEKPVDRVTSSLYINKNEFGLEKFLNGFSSNTCNLVYEALEEVYSNLHSKELSNHCLGKVKRFLTVVKSRPGAKSLLNFACPWIKLLIKGIFCSDFISFLVSGQPSLIEGLNDKKLISSDPSIWRGRALEIIEGHTEEETFERIRKVKNERILNIALQDINNCINTKEVVKNLSGTADFIVEQTYKTLCSKLNIPFDIHLGVFSLGKFGARELGYFSDLDLMFVYHPSKMEHPEIIPDKIIKLIQRFMRMLSINLQEGPGYEVDTKIRPSGNYGPLVVTKKNWEDYYLNKADLWEIQSLLRFRYVCGNKNLGEELEYKTQQICFKKRDEKKVWNRIGYLRKRMEKERADENTEDKIDIKLGYGGLVDIEFAVQGLQLLRGYACPSLRQKNMWNLLEETLNIINMDKETSEFIKKAFYSIRSLLQRFQLYSSINSSSLKKSQFQNLLALRLWPIPDVLSVEQWNELLSIKRRIRRFWNEITKV